MQAGTVELKPDHTTIGLPVRRRRFVRAALVAATVLVIFLGYELLTSLVAYTDDAYVRSDLVAIAPQVTGTIASVDVHDNQTVHRGDLLFTIDPVPFQLVVDERQAALREANAQAAADRAGVDAARDNIAAAVAALQLAKETSTADFGTDNGQLRLAPTARQQHRELCTRRRLSWTTPRQRSTRNSKRPPKAKPRSHGPRPTWPALSGGFNKPRWSRRSTAISTTSLSVWAIWHGRMRRLSASSMPPRGASWPITSRTICEAFVRIALSGSGRFTSLALLPCSHSRYRARHKPRSGSAGSSALRRPDHGLDQIAATLPGDTPARRASTRRHAFHGC